MSTTTRSRTASHRSRRSPRKAYTKLNPSQMPCADLFTTGYCKFGDSCLFSHEFDIIPKEDPSPHPPPYMVKNQFEDGHFHDSSSSAPSSSKTSPSTQSLTLPTADTPSSASTRLPDVSQPTERRGEKPFSKPRRKPKRLHHNGVPAYFPMAPMHFSQGPYAPWTPPAMYNQPGLIPGYYVWPACLPLPVLENDGSTARKPSVGEPKVKATAGQVSEQTAHPRAPKNSAKASFSRPVPAHYYLGVQAPLYPPPAFQEPEVYDFEDVEEEPENVVVEPKHGVETYQGSKVGVLGGGVKLGMVNKPSPRQLEAAEILTKQDLPFDEDEDDDDDDVEIVNRTLEPREVPLPESDSESEDDDDEVVSDIKKLEIDCSATTSALPPLTSTTFSWADDEDDESYFNSSLPFSPSTSAKEELASEPGPQSTSTTIQPSKPISYAAMAAAHTSSPPTVKSARLAPFSVPASDVPSSVAKTLSTSARPPSPASTTDGWTTATKGKPRAKSSSKGAASPKRDASGQRQNGSRQRGRTMHVPGADDRLIRASWAAPKIYNKLGFSMSNTQAREIELLRLVEQKKLREARETSASSR